MLLMLDFIHECARAQWGFMVQVMCLSDHLHWMCVRHCVPHLPEVQGFLRWKPRHVQNGVPDRPSWWTGFPGEPWLLAPGGQKYCTNTLWKVFHTADSLTITNVDLTYNYIRLLQQLNICNIVRVWIQIYMKLCFTFLFSLHAHVTLSKLCFFIFLSLFLCHSHTRFLVLMFSQEVLLLVLVTTC